MDNASWLTIAPELVLMVMACLITLVDLGVRSRTRTLTYVLSLITLVVVAAINLSLAQSPEVLTGWGGLVVSDTMGHLLRAFAALAVLVTLVYGRPYAADRDMLRGGEMFILSLFALLGMSFMISGQNFIMIYLGLELLTLSSYALVALRRDHAQATEAAMK